MPHPVLALAALRRRLPADAVFSGLTAAWLHGLDVEPDRPIEVTVAPHGGISARSGMALRRAVLAPGEVVERRGLAATSLPRTLADISGRLDLVEAVVIADMALHAGLLDLSELAAWVAGNHGRKGVATLRRVVELAQPASESPMETRLRLLLELAGLPRPQCQVSLCDDRGRFLGRADLFYPGPRLVIEFDGGIHREKMVADNRRQNLLQGAGYGILRFTGADVLGHPEQVAAQVRAALAPGARIRRRMLAFAAP